MTGKPTVSDEPDADEKGVQNVPEFEEKPFWDKVLSVAKAAGREVIESVLTLYYALIDGETPRWAQAIIVGALAYFVNPIDVILDAIPGLGYTDDLGVLAAAIGAVAAHIKPEHRKRARDWVARNFGGLAGEP